MIGRYHRAVSIFVCSYDIFTRKGGRVMNDQSNNARGMLRLKDHILSIDPVEEFSLGLSGTAIDAARIR